MRRFRRTPDPERRYCVIGAGYAGLGVIKALIDSGIAFDCYEQRDDVGGNWYGGVYDSTHIISSRDSTAYADFPMPRHYPEFPGREDMLAYLRSFAEAFGLREHIRFNTRVERAEPLGDRGLDGWRVSLSTGETHDYAGLVVCNGHHWAKRVPDYPGEFEGKVLHSKDYQGPKDFGEGPVVVVGAGNSGCDIAVEAATSGRETYMSMRRGYHFLPHKILGIPTADWDRLWLPVWLQKVLLNLCLLLIVGPVTRYGLQRPRHGVFDRHPIVNTQILLAFGQGRVRPKPDIRRIDGDEVEFVDGTRTRAGTLVYATGYDIRFPMLDDDVFRWERGYPELVARLIAPKVANLYIFGLAQPRGGAGQLITLAAELLAKTVRAQERLPVPLGDLLGRWRPPDSEVLVGVYEAKREMIATRVLIDMLLARDRIGRSPRRAPVALKRLEPVRSSQHARVREPETLVDGWRDARVLPF